MDCWSVKAGRNIMEVEYMNETRYMISETAKLLQVEPHVLRYWEEELKINVKRNEMGHRYYTDKDLQTFLKVKELKKNGMQLRAIRKMLDENGDIEIVAAAKEDRVVPFVRPENTITSDVIKIVEKNSSKQSKEDKFYQIMERLIDELNTDAGKEGRYRKLDEAIRRHQQTRKMAAAAIENGKPEKIKTKSRKKIWKHKNKS